MAKPYLFLTLEYPPQIGGVANYYSNIVAADATQSIEVITNAHNTLTHPWLKIFSVLWRRHRREPIRKIIVGHILPIGTVVWLWHALFGTPYLVYTHGMDITVPQRYWRKRWLLRRILRSAETVITVSRYSAMCLETFCPDIKTKIIVISPAPHITTERFPANLGLWTDLSNQYKLQSPYFLSVGRLVTRKGFAEAIKALADAQVTLKQWHYYIVGNGPEREHLAQLIHDLKLQQRVHLLPALSDGMVAELYRHAEFFVLPAQELPNGDFEGYGIVTVEANSFGKPTIATRSGGLTDAIQDGQTGCLIPPSDRAALRDAIVRLCVHADSRQQLGTTAQRWAQQQTWQAKSNQLMALLER